MGIYHEQKHQGFCFGNIFGWIWPSKQKITMFGNLFVEMFDWIVHFFLQKFNDHSQKSRRNVRDRGNLNSMGFFRLGWTKIQPIILGGDFNDSFCGKTVKKKIYILGEDSKRTHFWTAKNLFLSLGGKKKRQLDCCVFQNSMYIDSPTISDNVLYFYTFPGWQKTPTRLVYFKKDI